MTSESEGLGSEEKDAQGMTSTQPVGEMPAPQVPETEAMAAPAQPRATGRRAQLKLVREHIQSLSKDVGNFRKSHEASTKRMQAELESMRKELAKQPKGLSEHLKGHQVDTKRLEKQISGLRTELASFKKQMAKEAAKSRVREEAAISRIVAKLKAPAPKKPRAKRSKSKR